MSPAANKECINLRRELQVAHGVIDAQSTDLAESQKELSKLKVLLMSQKIELEQSRSENTRLRAELEEVKQTKFALEQGLLASREDAAKEIQVDLDSSLDELKKTPISKCTDVKEQRVRRFSAVEILARMEERLQNLEIKSTKRHVTMPHAINKEAIYRNASRATRPSAEKISIDARRNRTIVRHTRKRKMRGACEPDQEVPPVQPHHAPRSPSAPRDSIFVHKKHLKEKGREPNRPAAPKPSKPARNRTSILRSKKKQVAEEISQEPAPIKNRAPLDTDIAAQRKDDESETKQQLEGEDHVEDEAADQPGPRVHRDSIFIHRENSVKSLVSRNSKGSCISSSEASNPANPAKIKSDHLILGSQQSRESLFGNGSVNSLN